VTEESFRRRQAAETVTMELARASQASIRDSILDRGSNTWWAPARAPIGLVDRRAVRDRFVLAFALGVGARLTIEARWAPRPTAGPIFVGSIFFHVGGRSSNTCRLRTLTAPLRSGTPRTRPARVSRFESRDASTGGPPPRTARPGRSTYSKRPPRFSRPCRLQSSSKLRRTTISCGGARHRTAASVFPLRSRASIAFAEVGHAYWSWRPSRPPVGAIRPAFNLGGSCPRSRRVKESRRTWWPTSDVLRNAEPSSTSALFSSARPRLSSSVPSSCFPKRTATTKPDDAL